MRIKADTMHKGCETDNRPLSTIGLHRYNFHGSVFACSCHVLPHCLSTQSTALLHPSPASTHLEILLPHTAFLLLSSTLWLSSLNPPDGFMGAALFPGFPRLPLHCFQPCPPQPKTAQQSQSPTQHGFMLSVTPGYKILNFLISCAWMVFNNPLIGVSRTHMLRVQARFAYVLLQDLSPRISVFSNCIPLYLSHL